MIANGGECKAFGEVPAVPPFGVFVLGERFARVHRRGFFGGWFAFFGSAFVSFEGEAPLDSIARS